MPMPSGEQASPSSQRLPSEASESQGDPLRQGRRALPPFDQQEMASAAQETGQRRRRRTYDSSPLDRKKGVTGKIIGGLAAAAVVAAGAFVTPKISSFFDKANANVPEIYSVSPPSPTGPPAAIPGANQPKPAAAPSTRVATPPRAEPEPIDRHLVENTSPTLPGKSTPLQAEEEQALPSNNEKVPAILSEPRDFLDRYLMAARWEQLVPWSLNGESLQSEMSAYYQQSPYQPEKVHEITFQHKQKLPDSDYQFYLFKVITEANKGSFPMTVEETPDGFRTDWQAYVQFKDAHLQRFLDNPEIGPNGKGETKTFNVILRRAHDFTNNVPDKENKWCYKIDAPVDDLQGGFCHIPKYSKYGQELDAELKWLLLYFPIVDLRWETDPDHPDKPYVRLLQIRQYNWRGHDPNSTSSSESLTSTNAS